MSSEKLQGRADGLFSTWFQLPQAAQCCRAPRHFPIDYVAFCIKKGQNQNNTKKEEYDCFGCFLLVGCWHHPVDFFCFFTSEVSQTCGPGKSNQLKLFALCRRSRFRWIPADQELNTYLLILRTISPPPCTALFAIAPPNLFIILGSDWWRCCRCCCW